MVASDPQVAALAEEIESMLLSGPRKRVTDDVRAWGKQQGRTLSDERLLEAYNEAVAESHDAVRQRLSELSEEDDRRPVLLRLLNDPRATDIDRTLTLGALTGHLRSEELAELGRVSARQRPGVIPALVALLATIDHPHARFLERKVVPDSGRASTGGTGNQLLAQELGGACSLYAALALDEAGMGRLKVESLEVRDALGEAADSLDEELIVAGRSSSGLSDYESIVRRELHLLVLIASLPIGERLADRARDSLLAIDVSRFQWNVASQVPADELATYLRRSLSTENRRKRPDRATVALRCVELLPAEVREEVRGTVVDSLKDRDAEVRFEAAAALAEYLEPSSEERSLLVSVAGALPDELRARLQPLLGALGGEVEAMAFPQAIEWATSAPADEVAWRATALFETWEERVAEVTTHDAESAIGVCARVTSVGALVAPSDVSDALLAATEKWLHEQGGTAAATRSLMRGWSGFSSFALSHFASFALNARESRRLLAEAIRAAGTIDPEALARAAELELDSQRYRLVVVPELRIALQQDPGAFEPAAAAVADHGLRALLAAAIEVIGEAGRRHDELSAIASEETTEALSRTRAQVLEALELAERDSVRDRDLAAQLALIRRALGFEGDEQAARPSPAVISWRREACERFPSLGLDADGVQPLRAGSDTDDLVGVMVELDPRVYGRGVVPAADRAHYAEDLSKVLDAYARVSSPPDLPRTASAKLRDEVGRAIAADPDQKMSRLRDALIGSPSKAQARRVAIEARYSDPDAVAGTLDSLNVAAARTAAPAVGAALVGEHHAFIRAREAHRTQESRAAAEIAQKLAVPFQAIESRLFSYFRLRAILEDVGWKQIATRLGAEIGSDAIDPARFTVRSEESSAAAGDVIFLVRSLGIQIEGQVVEPAVVERVSSIRQDEEEKNDRT